MTEFQFDAYSPESWPAPLSRIRRDARPTPRAVVRDHQSVGAEPIRRRPRCAWPIRGLFSSAKGNIVNDFPGRQPGRTLGTTDPPCHDQLRKLVNDAFARRTVGEYEAGIRTVARERIFTAPDDDLVDLRNGVAFPSSAAVIGDVLGVDLIHQETLAVAFTLVLDEPLRLGANPATDDPQRATAMDTVLGLVSETIAARRANPQTDVVSTLIEAGLSDDDLRWIVFTFLGAGLESSTAQFLPSALALAQHPDARRRLVDDPAMIPNAYEEMVRYDCGPQRFHRVLVATTPSSTDNRCAPVTRCWCCTARPTVTTANSNAPTS